MFFKTATLKAQIQEIKPSKGWGLQKSAANTSHWNSVESFPEKYQQLFNNYVVANRVHIGDYNPEFKYYRVIALHGDVPNDNGDLWRFGSIDNPDEPELLRFDKSADKHVFETFNGRGNFKNHENDDVSKAVGLILDAAPNYGGRFIEALIAVDEKKDPELVRSIDMGYIDSVSMGCLTGYSICTACGNVARTENEYCDHIKYSKSQVITYNGKQVKVAEDNYQTNFIELSWVTVPADPDAKLLERVASRSVSLSDDHDIIYQAMSLSFDDAKTVARNADEYYAYLQAIKKEVDNRLK